MKFQIFLFSIAALSVNALVAVQPTIYGVNPANGAASGGTSVTIVGSGFSDVTAISFGGTPAVSYVINSDTSLTAITSAHSPKVVNVEITTAEGTNTPSENSYFTYQGNWQAYVANSYSDTVSVFDASTNAVNHTIAVGNEPDAMNITSDGSQVYVANYGNFFGHTVSVINSATSVVESSVVVGYGPNAIGISPQGANAYVVNYGETTISTLDTLSNLVTDTIAVGNEPDAIAITSDGSQAYIANYNDGTVSVIDLFSNTVSSTLTVGAGPVAIVITPDGQQVYVANFISSTVSVINISTQTVAEISVGSEPNALAITPDGASVYVANSADNTVSIIDTATNTFSNFVTVGSGPFVLNITPDGLQVYVANYNDGTVSVIETTTNTVSNTITIGNQPNAIAIAPDGKHVYFANVFDNTISVIDTVTKTVSATIPVGSQPTQIAITADQAPLAKFVATIAAVPNLSVFDASASVSPTGTISLYSWDFGDGHTLNTSNSTASHHYATPGMFEVNLTVTNSAGTSLEQVFNYSSFSNNNFGSYSLPLTNNGGPTAATSQQIAVPPASPKNFRGCQFTDQFLNKTIFTNRLAWTAPQSGGIVSYKIYRNAALTDFVAEIPASDALKYEDCDVKKNKIYTYYIISIGLSGASQPVPTIVTPKNCQCN